MTRYTRPACAMPAHKLRIRLSALTPGTPEWAIIVIRLNALEDRK